MDDDPEWSNRCWGVDADSLKASAVAGTLLPAKGVRAGVPKNSHLKWI